MRSETIIRTGAVLAGLAVIAGAFGAHALKDTFVDEAAAGQWQLASQYQMYHAVALLAALALARPPRSE